MIYLLITAALGALYLIYLKLKGLFQEKKLDNLKEELKDQRHESDKAVIEADVSYDDLKRLLDEYNKSKK